MTEVLDRPADTGGDGDDERVRMDRLRSAHRTLPDMEARQNAIRSELAKIDDIAEPDEDDLGWQGTLIQEFDDLDKLASPLRKRAKDLDRVMRAAQDPANREESVPRTPDLATRNVTSVDPFKELERVRAGLVEPRTVRGWALDTIERSAKRGDMQAEWAEQATLKTENQFVGQTNVARHILETGSDDYLEAFRAYLHDPQGESRRAALSLTSANGGYLLPFILDFAVA